MLRGRPDLVAVLCVGVVAALVGALISGLSPAPDTSGMTAAVLLLVGLWALVLVHVRNHLLAFDLACAVFGGLMILGYGFANVGALPRIPLPVSDLLVVTLGWYIVLFARPWGAKVPNAIVAMFAYMTIATVRLIFDFPTWGKDALRDYSLAVEVLALPIGYWLVAEFGLERFKKTVTWILFAVIVYAWLFPLRIEIADIGPAVGLQKSVPLLGSFNGPALLAAFYYFVLVRPFRSSLWIAAAALPPIAIQQSRGMFIALPAIGVALLVAPRGSTGSRLRSSLALTVVIGVILLGVSFTFSPEGRIGPTNATFIASQLETLGGSGGPSSGSIQVRRQWLHDSIRRVLGHPHAILIGLGLGPDLTNGFRSEDDTLVRKPHNDYLEAFARLGLVGLTALIALLAWALTPIWRAARRESSASPALMWWIVASALGFMFIAATQPLLAFPYGAVPLFLILGAGIALADQPKTK